MAVWPSPDHVVINVPKPWSEFETGFSSSISSSSSLSSIVTLFHAARPISQYIH